MKTLRTAVVLLWVIGFTVIAYFVTSGASLLFDQAVMEAVVSLRQNWLTRFLSVFTHTGDWQSVTLICAFLLMFQRTRRPYGYPMTCSAIVSVSLYQILKYIFQRPRPEVLHLIDQGGYSFPSGHSLTSLVFYSTFLLLLHRRLLSDRGVGPQAADEKGRAGSLASRNRILFWSAFAFCSSYVLLMGFSRIYLGVHHPTDVAASWLLGACLIVWLAPVRKAFTDGH